MINNSEADALAHQNYAVNDTTKIWLDISGLKVTGSKLREILYKKHGIYISRYTNTCALFNVHFGITKSNINSLVQALHEIEIKKDKWCISQLGENTISEHFVIPYPPGVPILVPGELISKMRLQKIKECMASGVSLKLL